MGLGVVISSFYVLTLHWVYILDVTMCVWFYYKAPHVFSLNCKRLVFCVGGIYRPLLEKHKWVGNAEGRVARFDKGKCMDAFKLWERIMTNKNKYVINRMLN